jgi:hypothetical protein
VRPLARVAALAALLAIAGLQPAFAADAAPTSPPMIAGRWKGAKLRCQKEESKLVRCGTPTPFEIRLDDSGTGKTADESLPKDFTWRWTSATEIAVMPVGGGPEVKLFSVEKEDDDTLTFQAYVYLPTGDPNAPAESRYLHFVFDVSRAD